MKKNYINFFKLFFFLVLIASCGWLSSYTFQERILQAALFSGIYPLQKLGAEQLHDYPSRAAAGSLIAFINLHAPSDMQIKQLESEIRVLKEELDFEGLLPSNVRSQKNRKLAELNKRLEQEKSQYDQEYPRRSRLADAGMKSICRLTGHSFGTAYQQHGGSYGWSKIEKKKWGRVVGEVNDWAMVTFSKDLLEQFERSLEKNEDS